MEFTNIQQSIIEKITVLKTISVFLGVFGVGGLLNGAYSSFYRTMTPEAQVLNATLILFSFGIFLLAYFLYQSSEIIEKLTKGKSF